MYTACYPSLVSARRIATLVTLLAGVAPTLIAFAADPPPGPRNPAAAKEPAIIVPPDALYVCVMEKGGVRKQTTIELEPKVKTLCTSHPEMGPCQYERNACRRKGGRVYAAGGQEITKATEAEYDKKVVRVRLKGG